MAGLARGVGTLNAPDARNAPDDAPPGPFPTWGWLYAAVVLYTAALILLLGWLTVALDHGAS